jgi:hypothetical protein
MTESDKLVASVQGTWEPFRRLAGELAERLNEPTLAGWTARGMLGTIAFWDEAAFGWITLGLRGGELPEGWAFGSGFEQGEGWPAADVHNAREAAWAALQPSSAVLARCDRAHRQLLGILSTVTGEEARAHAGYFAQLGSHYDDHMAELEALAAGAGTA